MQGERGDLSTAQAGERLPDFSDLNVLALSRQSGHPVLAAVAAGLLPRTLSGRSPMAFYEDGPYQL